MWSRAADLLEGWFTSLAFILLLLSISRFSDVAGNSKTKKSKSTNHVSCCQCFRDTKLQWWEVPVALQRRRERVYTWRRFSAVAPRRLQRRNAESSVGKRRNPEWLQWWSLELETSLLTSLWIISRGVHDLPTEGEWHHFKPDAWCSALLLGTMVCWAVQDHLTSKTIKPEFSSTSKIWDLGESPFTWKQPDSKGQQWT